MLIIILALILFFGLVVAGTCYANLVKTYKKYSSTKAEIDSNALTVISASVKFYNMKTTVGLTQGFLTDFYSPKKDIIALSQGVAYGSSVADISVASHEFGHALQKYDNSKLIKVSSFFGVVNKIANFFLPILLVCCLVFVFIDSLAYLAPILFYISVGVWFLTFVFRLITIPVELDASKRAYNMLKENNILTKDELKITKQVLDAAAFTYFGSLFKELYKLYYYIKKAFRRD